MFNRKELPRPYLARCWRSGKPSYDKKGAQSAANWRYKEAKVKLRIYECPECFAWHLTHHL